MKHIRNAIFVVLITNSVSCTNVEKSVGRHKGHTYLANYEKINTDQILTLDLDPKTRMPQKGTERDFAIEEPKSSSEPDITVTNSTYWLSIILQHLGISVQPVVMGEKMKCEITSTQFFSPKRPQQNRPNSSFVYSQVVGYEKQRNVDAGEWTTAGAERLALGFKAKSLTSTAFSSPVLDSSTSSSNAGGLALTYNHSKELPKKNDSSVFSVCVAAASSNATSCNSAKACAANSIGKKFTPYELPSSDCQEFEFAKGDVLVLYEKGTYANKWKIRLIQLVSVAEAKTPLKGYSLTFNVESIDIAE